MELKRGSVVRATAGRDKDGFFVVVQTGPVAICDGSRRRLEKPKQKNLKHLAATGTVVPEQALETNREIRKALRGCTGATPTKEVVSCPSRMLSK